MIISIFLPKAIVRDYLGPFVNDILDHTPTITTHDGYVIPGYVIRMTEPTFLRLKTAIAVRGEELIEIGQAILTEENRIIPFWSILRPPQVDVQDLEFARNRHGFISRIEAVLSELSRRSGERISLHIVQGPYTVPFAEDGTVHFVYRATPPGLVQTNWYSHVCGCKLHAAGSYIKVYGPTSGYGMVVKDPEDEEQSIAQIVEDTIYLFVPFIEAYQLVGPPVFKKLVAAAWQGFLQRKIATQDPGSEDREGVIALLGEWRNELPQFWKSEIKKLDDDLLEIESRMTEALRKRAMYLQLERANHEIEKTPVDIAREYDALCMAPGVSRVIRVGNAFHVLTKRAYYRLDGPTRFLGRYWIRFEQSGNFGFWGEEYGHPKRVLHPHISPNGIPCFGSISRSIKDAVLRQDAAKSMALIWRWIEEGYDPEGADTPVEEFMTVAEQPDD